MSQKIAWIEKDASNIPDAYSDDFFKSICSRHGNDEFCKLFECQKYDRDGEKVKIWVLKDKKNGKQLAYESLKKKGYYELTIQRMIKHIADKLGAHLDDSNSIWIGIANSAEDYYKSAISVFAMQMIYAATKQIKELEHYNKMITIQSPPDCITQ